MLCLNIFYPFRIISILYRNKYWLYKQWWAICYFSIWRLTFMVIFFFSVCNLWERLKKRFFPSPVLFTVSDENGHWFHLQVSALTLSEISTENILCSLNPMETNTGIHHATFYASYSYWVNSTSSALNPISTASLKLQLMIWYGTSFSSFHEDEGTKYLQDNYCEVNKFNNSSFQCV